MIHLARKGISCQFEFYFHSDHAGSTMVNILSAKMISKPLLKYNFEPLEKQIVKFSPRNRVDSTICGCVVCLNTKAAYFLIKIGHYHRICTFWFIFFFCTMSELDVSIDFLTIFSCLLRNKIRINCDCTNKEMHGNNEKKE